MTDRPFTTPLAELLRACDQQQRITLATRAGTSVNYLYSLAGCHRERVSAALALAIEDASRDLHASTQGVTPVVTIRELASMCAIAGFEHLPAE
jgi:hypothetical protein